MQLKLNGTLTEIQNGMTVAEMLDDLRIEPKGVAVEVNLKIVKKQDYQNYLINEGDSVEIVNFVGGG